MTTCLLLIKMSDSCHLDSASNVKIGVECQIFVIDIFFNCGRVLQFGAHSKYYKGALTQKRSFLALCTTFRSDFHFCWENQNKHSMLNSSFNALSKWISRYFNVDIFLPWTGTKSSCPCSFECPLKRIEKKVNILKSKFLQTRSFGKTSVTRRISYSSRRPNMKSIEKDLFAIRSYKKRSNKKHFWWFDKWSLEFVKFICLIFAAVLWVEFNYELSWFFTNRFRAFYLICRKNINTSQNLC